MTYQFLLLLRKEDGDQLNKLSRKVLLAMQSHLVAGEELLLLEVPHQKIFDGNVCSLISTILSFHRIGLKEHLIDPHFCVTLAQTPDFPSWDFMKILTAMPSLQPFSL